MFNFNPLSAFYSLPVHTIFKSSIKEYMQHILKYTCRGYIARVDIDLERTKVFIVTCRVFYEYL